MKRRRDELRPEYDLTRLKGGVRGKYHQRATAGTNLVLLEPDVALAFLLFSLVASGQIRLRRIDGWRKIAGVINQHTGVAA